MSDKIIEMVEVNKWFGDFQVLKDINLEVLQKQKIVVCGPSGSGKSTLMSILYGFYQADSGAIAEQEKSTEIRSAHDAIAAGSAWYTSISCW